MPLEDDPHEEAIYRTERECLPPAWVLVLAIAVVSALAFAVCIGA